MAVLFAAPMWRLMRLWTSAIGGEWPPRQERRSWFTARGAETRRIDRNGRDAGPQGSAADEEREPQAASREWPASRTRALALAGLVPLIAALLALVKGDLTIVAPCRLDALRSAPQRTRRAGVLSALHYREGESVRRGAVIGALDTFALQKELTSLQAREAMLRVEAENAARSIPFVALQRAGEAAEVAAEVPKARIALQEAADGRRHRLSEARDRVAEAEAVMTAAEQKAARLRGEVNRMARGDYPSDPGGAPRADRSGADRCRAGREGIRTQRPAR
jgi:hypothetical protein